MKRSPTIVPARSFHDDVVADDVEKSLKCGDKRALLTTLTSISNHQRQLLRDAYGKKFDKDLAGELAKKFGGNLEKLVVALMSTPVEFDVKQLKKATKGLGTDDDALIEILCTRSPARIAKILAAYEKTYSASLADDIADDTSGEYRDMLLSLASMKRDQSRHTNDEKAAADALDLVLAALLTNRTSKEGLKLFTDVLTSRNFNHLRKVIEQGKELWSGKIDEMIVRNFGGDVAKAYLAIVAFVTDKEKFFAEQLYKSMKGLGTNDNTLMRVLVSRSEIDLDGIRVKFDELYKNTLAEYIKGDTSGDYRAALLMVVEGNRALADALDAELDGSEDDYD